MPIPSRSPSRTPSRTPSQGLTLVECLVSLALLAVLVGAAAPHLDDLVQARRLTALASLVETDLQHARSLAVARQATLRFEIRPGSAGGPPCYVVHTGRKGDCRCEPHAPPACPPAAIALHAVPLETPARLTLQASAASFVIEPVLGAVTPATSIELADAGGRRARLVVNAMGRVRPCAAGRPMAGWPPC